MTLADFEASLQGNAPPAGLSPLLLALWHDGRGDWERAHQIAQEIDAPAAAWVHAYLHRKEGDLSNARYWYRRADRPESTASLESEWARIVSDLLD